VAILGSNKTGLDVPVLAVVQGCATTPRTAHSPPAEGDHRQDHRHVVAPNRWYMTDLSVSERKPVSKMGETRTYWYLNQKVFPPLVSRGFLVIEFTLTLGSYE
jgi:hypothetical protein